jgi:thiosulfate dehydrogenase (quinone) large subunit
VLGAFRSEAGKDGILLVPLRLFIGLGWLRAFAEKASDPTWWDGTQPAAFLAERVARGEVALPPYEGVVTGFFLPQAAVVAWVLMAGQLLAGLAILSGTLTNAALLGALFMNLNFLLAGEPNPSAFYVVIQAALLLAGTGSVLGVDSRLGGVVCHPLLTARPSAAARSAIAQRWAATAGALALGFAVYALTQVSDWTPAGSVHDPAMILATLAGMAAGWAAIAWLRGQEAVSNQPSAVSLFDHPSPITHHPLPQPSTTSHHQRGATPA